MTKPFLTYSEQIEELNRKGLIITDENKAKEELTNISYFSLIGGYKEPFRDPSTRRYIGATTFDDILAMYSFDKDLRSVFFKYISDVEICIQNRLSYAFCEVYGEKQEYYLNLSCYNVSDINRKSIIQLIKTLEFEANINKKHDYIVHQRIKYNNVPLWVLMHTLSFGQVSRMYEYSKSNIRSKVASLYDNLNDSDLERILKNLVLYRNICVHHERLFSHRIYTDFPDTDLLKKMSIPKIGSQYINGKKDLFGVVIALRYLLPNKTFLKFKNEISQLIDGFLKNTPIVSKEWIYKKMGFPDDWKDIIMIKIN